MEVLYIVRGEKFIINIQKFSCVFIRWNLEYLTGNKKFNGNNFISDEENIGERRKVIVKTRKHNIRFLDARSII